MRNYDRVHPRKTEGIEERKAYIVGGGIAGLSAAAFLVRDAQMPGKCGAGLGQQVAARAGGNVIENHGLI